MPHADRFELDKHKLRRAFEGAAARYDDVALLQREVGSRVIERLDVVRMVPGRIADVGCGTGFCTLALARRYPRARLVAVDLAESMLGQLRARLPWWQRLRRRYRFVCGDAAALPLADASVDLLFSNLTIQWCTDLDRVFAEFRRVLAPQGLVLFSTFGPDTLKELRQAWAAVDDATHVNAFIDMHDIGDAMLRAGFADPVMDMEYLTVTYQDAFTLMRDLKQLGAHNVTAGRSRGLTSPRQLQRVADAYEQWRKGGTLPATYEVVYGHAWAPAARLASQPAHGMATVSVAPPQRGRRP